MATPGKSAQKKKKEKSTPGKNSFNSPFSCNWRPLPQEDMHFILQTLKDKLVSTGLEKKEVKVFRPWWKKKLEKPAATSEPDLQKASQDDAAPCDSPKNGWTKPAARRQLAIGINEVTKALERNELKLLLVCKSVKPIHMTTHLIALSATRGVPACQVPRLSQNVSENLGLKSVLALGFRRGSSTEDEVFADTVEAIKPRVPVLDVEWLRQYAARVTHDDPGGTEEKEEEGAKEESEEKDDKARGQKRKLERDLEGDVNSPSSSMLQPLKVKRVIANPAKKKKVKPKKKKT